MQTDFPEGKLGIYGQVSLKYTPRRSLKDLKIAQMAVTDIVDAIQTPQMTHLPVFLKCVIFIFEMRHFGDKTNFASPELSLSQSFSAVMWFASYSREKFYDPNF